MKNASREYVAFMEETKERMEKLSVKGICVIARLSDGAVYTHYHNSDMMDKMIFAGVIQQDVTRDIIKANKGNDAY